MPRYIDADALRRETERKIKANNEYGRAVVDGEFLDLIDDAFTEDVAEVRHGSWVYHECVSSYDGCKSGYSCSVCNAFVDEEVFDTDEFHKTFCGNCGAKMDAERSEG